MATEMCDLLPPWAPSAVRDPVSTRFPPALDGAPWGGDVQAAPGRIFQAKPWGSGRRGCPSPRCPGGGGQAGALERTPPAPRGGVPSHRRPGPCGTRTERLFQAGRGSGGPGGRVSHAQTGGPPGGRGAAGEGREPAYRLARAPLPAAPLPPPPRGFLRPGLPGRWQGAGRAGAPGRRAQGAVGGTTSEPPGRAGRGTGPEVGGRGGAGPGPAPLNLCRVPSSAWRGPSSSRAGRGSFGCR